MTTCLSLFAYFFWLVIRDVVFSQLLCDTVSCGLSSTVNKNSSLAAQTVKTRGFWIKNLHEVRAHKSLPPYHPISVNILQRLPSLRLLDLQS